MTEHALPPRLAALVARAGASPAEPPTAAAWPGLLAELVALCQAVDSAQAASAAKSEFVAYVSHELRHPLNRIIGFVDLLLLERDPLVERQREQLRAVVESGHHLRAIADDLIDLGRIEAGHYALDPQPLAVADAIADAIAALAPLAHHCGVLLEPATLGELPPVRADRVRLRQILYNLVSNGVKYTDRGGAVRVRAHRDGDTVAIAVADTGVGIAEADLARLFQPWVRLAASADGPPGAGLGLALTRRLVELHGGSIAVTSARGSGTTFTVRLPVG